MADRAFGRNQVVKRYGRVSCRCCFVCYLSICSFVEPERKRNLILYLPIIAGLVESDNDSHINNIIIPSAHLSLISIRSEKVFAKKKRQ